MTAEVTAQAPSIYDNPTIVGEGGMPVPSDGAALQPDEGEAVATEDDSAHNVCCGCWGIMHPDSEPAHESPMLRKTLACCRCGESTFCGIRFRSKAPEGHEFNCNHGYEGEWE